MSRIHEALQKAEQERMAHQPPAAPEVAPILDASVPLPAVTAPTEMAAAPVLSAGPLSFEALLARCARHEWKPDPQHMLFFDLSKHHGPGMEEFRTLRARLYQIREKSSLKIIMVGSALPAEGKSFVAANLAQCLVRQHGRRVLLIDADLRRCSLHECLGAPQAPGLTEFLQEKADEFAVVQRGPGENLFLIPGGKTSTNPAELIAGGRLKLLLQRLAPLFDWIILDTPPVVPVSDASRIAELCDGVLLVLLAATTPYEAAQKARQEFRARPLLGVVLNRVAPRDGYGGYYYAYGYGQEKQRRKRDRKR